MLLYLTINRNAIMWLILQGCKITRNHHWIFRFLRIWEIHYFYFQSLHKMWTIILYRIYVASGCEWRVSSQSIGQKCCRMKRNREMVCVFSYSVYMHVCIYIYVVGRKWRVCTCVCVSKVEVGWDRERYYLAWRNVLLLFSFSSVHNHPEIGEMEKQSLYTHRDTENTGDVNKEEREKNVC